LRHIVVDTLAKMQAIGQGVGNAQAFVASADARSRHMHTRRLTRITARHIALPPAKPA
jgi:hypothetical protein